MRIVILGCGFAGLETAFWLARLTSDADISVINSSEFMVYTPSLIWLPPQRERLEDITVDLEHVLGEKGISFYKGVAAALMPDSNEVALVDGRRLDYDYLVIAAGWRSKRSHIKGNEHALFPCDIPDALELTRIVDEMDGGSITFAIEGERPGPGAEFVGVLDTYLRHKGVRDRFKLNLADEKHRLLIHLGRECCEMLTEYYADRGINLYLGKNLVEVRPGMAIFDDGTEVPSDVTCAVGKLEAPDVLQRLAFANSDGFIPVHNDLLCKAYDTIYVVGDAALFDYKNVPKVAHYAIEQGQIAARNIYSRIRGRRAILFDAAHSFENLYIVNDFGETAVLARNYKLIRSGSSVIRLKKSIEQYYLYTHRFGLTWQLLSLPEAA